MTHLIFGLLRQLVSVPSIQQDVWHDDDGRAHEIKLKPNVDQLQEKNNNFFWMFQKCSFPFLVISIQLNFAYDWIQTTDL